MQKRLPFLLLLGGLTAGVSAAPAQAAIIAFDMVNSASQNLNSYVNPFAGAFSSAGDGFQKFRRGVSPTIPFDLLDDSVSIFPPDSQGIIDEANTDEFFGIADTTNPDNAGDVSAEWRFDISGASGLSVSIDMGAMGDFESFNDSFRWQAAIDGGLFSDLFVSSVDENGSQNYTLAGGAVFALNDPMLANGILLDNNLQTLTAALAGQGSELTLRLTANTDGSGEGIAFQNLIVEGQRLAVPEPAALGLLGLGLAAVGTLARRRAGGERRAR